MIWMNLVCFFICTASGSNASPGRCHVTQAAGPIFYNNEQVACQPARGPSEGPRSCAQRAGDYQRLALSRRWLDGRAEGEFDIYSTEIWRGPSGRRSSSLRLVTKILYDDRAGEDEAAYRSRLSYTSPGLMRMPDRSSSAMESSPAAACVSLP